jgi:hypothetical protein
MAQINKPSDYFNTVLYTGDGTSSKSITGIGFQPDLVWVKSRVAAHNHFLWDAVRGVQKRISSNLTTAEGTDTNGLASFDSDGFTLGDKGSINSNTDNYASWNWKAGNSAGSSNTDGTITSTVTANQTAGFSIVKWTGDSSASATVGHGLGATPQVIITKEMNGTDYWHVYHHNLSTNNNLFLNVTNAQSAPSDGTIANVGSSTFGFQGSTNVVAVNESGIDNIGYCFVEKKGYSKFGYYYGNGNADGTFVYTGFKPAFVMLKNRTDASDWSIKDSKRPGYNQVNDILYPNLSNAEEHGGDIDIVSNGFKVRTTAANTNNNGSIYIYMAFAEEPLVGTNNVPATAR